NMGLLKCQLIVVAFLCYQLNLEVAAGPMKRIINGFAATPKQFPYQAFFDVFLNFNWVPLCGGVIISNRIILTAAHCIIPDALAYRIYLGALNKTNAFEEGQQQVVLDRSCAVVHPRFDPNQLINDIALFVVPFEMHFNAYIQPARLPDPRQSYENTHGVASGWGVTNSKGAKTDILQYASVDVLSLDECTKLIHQIHPGSIVPESYICLKPSGKSTCKGDSGGPLAIRNPDGSSTLLGLTSFGFGKCILEFPTVFTRVSSYLSWIKCH
ncbi:hypothetical protein KR044_010814, partial [Drosophila immigrans]